jgi:integrase/recombinase XerD
MQTNTLTENTAMEIFTEYLTIKGYSSSSRQSIINTVKRFVLWSEEQGIELHLITYADVLAYVSYCRKQGNKQRTIQVTISCLNHYYTFLISRKEITENPCSNVTIKGIKRQLLHDIFTPDELDSIYKTFVASAPAKGIGSQLTHKRNKIIAGLLIYQGLRTEEVARLKVTDINMREGNIFIAGGRRTNEREMLLQAHQLYDVMDYINETRKLLVTVTGKNTDALFVSLGSSDRAGNAIDKMVASLKKQNAKIKDAKHLRASVISNWLKVYNIRKVQYMAGHRYVSSTEAYQVNNMDGLKEDVNRYHPDI